MSLRIERAATAALSASTYAALIQLCDEAYDESTADYFAAIGPGEHILGWEDDRLVSHLMWVERWLQPAGELPLRTAYIEMVATAKAARNRGYATRLLELLPPMLHDFQLAALAPATDNLYLRLGWEYWRGPLSTRRDGVLAPDPEERIMVMELPHTPAGLGRDRPLSVEWRPGEVW